MTPRQRDWLAAGGIFLLALVVRLLALHWSFPEQFFFGKYLVLGRELLDNGLIADRPFSYSPVYVYFIALAKGLFGESLYAILVLQAAIGAGSCVLIHRIGRRVLRPWAALAAGVLAAGYRSFVLYDVTFLSDALGLFLQLSVVAVLWRPEEDKGLRSYLLAGALIGLCILQRPNSLLLLPLAAVALLLLRVERRHWIRCVGAMAGAVLVVVSPVALQNLSITGTPGVTASNPGYIFYSSNNGSAAGFRYSPPELYGRGAAFYEGRSPERLLGDAELSTVISGAVLGRPMTLNASSRYYLRFTLSHMGRYPGRYTGHLLRKLWLAVNAFETHDVLPVFARQRNIGLRLPLGFGWIAPLGLLGLALSLRRWREHLWLYLIGINQLTMMLAFYVVVRFRLALEAVLLLAAMLALQWAVDRLRDGRRAKLLAPGIALAVLFGLVHYLPPETANRARSRNLDLLLEEALRLERRGDVGRASQTVLELIGGDREELPRIFRARELEARLSASTSIAFDRESVISRLREKSASGEITLQELRYLGFLLLESRAWKEAEPVLDEALRRNPAAPLIRYDRARARLNLGRLEAARDDLSIALDDGLLFTSRGMQGSFLLAESYRVSGNTEEERRYREQAMRLSILTPWYADDMEARQLALQLRGSPDWVDPGPLERLIPY